ncbi:ferrous iron transport protein b : Ferrous iron transport protein b OS=Blastopirellula marina DSM 3645 GN=DSM3645_10732 PE=4 SV=1: FeoB_N: Gate: FeoB_C: Gate [Gemmataceae bacterium]|nr:ferrous iron transport protein b : Ferrous iron transport protein b OS=Blastopirellula marina DSM 3645 GN=DSM3645_10732 PE=4 SV=1: FeoB_N: Gate: FeoB_C: Gate [Gemmataceae bacterium]VTT99296.1 ferrous iron transport protein b : Ferrous iron transport protein b OS=Blastopirellula marina DSM 3645 GN=DSM3645_10732 PE=4 SV=1: FeoB_N: Gate: FeoB_C: Gate [Gemmataceae bacterium]
MLTKTLTVALVGNPNAGKSTLFNALSGLRQRVGNYPGVTVEMKKGQFTAGGVAIDLIDLPGTYSLAARSPDEMVAVDLLLGRRPEEPRPDVVLSIVDATNLDRHLYLTSQLLDLGEPVVVAVNMIDAAAAQGVKIDCTALSAQLGVAVVPIQANKGIGVEALTRAVLDAAESGKAPAGPKFPAAFDAEAERLQADLGGDVPEFLTRRVLLDVGGYVEQWLVEKHGAGLKQKLTDARQRLADANCGVPGVEARSRFAWVKAAVTAAVSRPAERPVTFTDKLDKVLTHRVWGTLVFLVVMFLMFQSIYLWAKPLMDAIDGTRESAAKLIESHMDQGPLRSLVADGVIKGVGSVLIFLPQIMILFGFIAFLEDCGYMARAAFLMDRLMSRCGLSGKSFIPLLSSVACAIPGIMATRVIENRRDRLATILVAPLMSCSARLPVYVLLIGAFLKDGYPAWLPGLVLFGLYMIGFTVAPLVALVLKRSLLRGAAPVFVMELPAYRRPKLGAVLRRMTEAGWAFTLRAGTIIFAAMVLVWALLYFPHTDPSGRSYPTRIEEAETAAKESEEKLKELKEKPDATEEDKAELEKLEAAAGEADKLNGEWKRQSLLGRAGLFMEPVFKPLGWDWKVGMAALASFPAREVIVGTLGLIYDVGDVDSGAIGDDEADDDAKAKATGLATAVKDDWAKDPVRGKYGVAVAASVMVFFALCCQCASTLAVIRRETRSWAWPAFTFAYMTALAYFGAFVTFQIGSLITDALR